MALWSQHWWAPLLSSRAWLHVCMAGTEGPAAVGSSRMQPFRTRAQATARTLSSQWWDLGSGLSCLNGETHTSAVWTPSRTECPQAMNLLLGFKWILPKEKTRLLPTLCLLWHRGPIEESTAHKKELNLGPNLRLASLELSPSRRESTAVSTSFLSLISS